MHQAVACADAPEGSSTHFVRGICRPVLDDSVACADVMQQEVAEGMDHLAPQSGRHDERATVDHRARRSGCDRGDMTDVAANIAEQLLSSLRVARRQQYVVDRRGLGCAHKSCKTINVIISILWIAGRLADCRSVCRTQTVTDALFVQVGIAGERE